MIRKVMRRNIVLIGGLAIIMILILLIIRSGRPAKDRSQNVSEGAINNNLVIPATIIVPGDEDRYRSPAPINVVVPETNTILTKEQAKVIAVPTVVVPAAEQGDADYRNFDIKGEGNVFTPSQITAYKGDKVHVNLTAVDKDYDLVFPSNSMMIRVKKGETKSLEFQALSEGSFTYYCSICGPTSPARGQIIIVK